MAMRVTQGITNRSYLTNLNTAQYNMNKSMEKLETGRKFSRVSEDVRAATKTIDVRSKVYRNEQIQDNVNSALEEMQMAESIVSEIKDITSEVTAEMFKALNEPSLGAGKETFLSFLDQSKQEVLRLANKQYNDKYLLGGLNVKEEPFKVDEDGMLHYYDYNGVTKADDPDSVGYAMSNITDDRSYVNDQTIRDDLKRLGLVGYHPVFDDEREKIEAGIVKKEQYTADKYDNLIAKCNNQINSNNKTISNNSAKIEENKSLIKQNLSMIEDNKKQITDLEEMIGDLDGKINEIDSSIENKTEEYNSYETNIDENNNKIDSNLLSINENNDNIALYNLLKDEAEELQKLEPPDEAAMDNLIQRIKEKLEDDDSEENIDVWVDKLETQTAILEGKNSSLSEENEALKKFNTDLSVKMSALDKEIQKFESDRMPLDDNRTELNNQKLSLESANENLAVENERLDADSVSRTARNKYLEETENVELNNWIDEYEETKIDELAKIMHLDINTSYYADSKGNLVATDLKFAGSKGDFSTQEKYYYGATEPITNYHENYIDVGAGKFQASSNSSRFNITIDGIGILGYGTTELEYEDSLKKGTTETISNNIYDMMTEMQSAIENEDVDKLSLIIENFKKQSENIVSSVAEIGVRGKFLETNISRLENESSNYAETKNYLEATDDASEITKYKGYQNSWNLILQFGGNVVPKSLMDYIR